MTSQYCSGCCSTFCSWSFFTSVMSHTHRFLGNSALWWDLKNDVTISTPWYLGLVFRTRAREGTLLQAQAGQYTSLLFQVCTHTQAGTHVLYTHSPALPEKMIFFVIVASMFFFLNAIEDAGYLCNFLQLNYGNLQKL